MCIKVTELIEKRDRKIMIKTRREVHANERRFQNINNNDEHEIN